MAKLYACIISPDAAKNALVAVAQEFAHAIEVTDGGVLFDVSGLERLMGKPDRVAQKILDEMQKQRVAGSVAVAETVDTAMLLARQQNVQSASFSLSTPDLFEQLPLTDLNIERDTLNVFSELGLRNISDLLAVPHDELVSRYGREFTDVIDVLEQRGKSLITPNIKENRVAWSFELDNPVEDFEQLIFLLNHGLERLFAEVKYAGFSTEHLDIKLNLRNKTEKTYEIKTSFPTLERAFWLKLTNLRGSLDPPEASIAGVDVIAHFTRPRPAQRGLYAVSRPEPESLLLTVGKLKKLVGEENVGVPMMLDQRLAEAFKLDPDAMPDVTTDKNGVSPRPSRNALRRGSASPSAAQNDSAATPPLRGIASKNISGTATARQASLQCDAAEPLRLIKRPSGTIAFTYFRPSVRAEVLIRDARLVFIKTRLLAGHVLNCSGVWKGNSKWWDQPWRTQEWDIEVENAGVYRLCKARDEWFLLGEYD
ncbi:MAG: hypothetical protein IPO41_16450 [Acidobacteria bacterium]|nr:hypothetical protein [Acidobacteriota bacterium]MBK9529858.1 hypothetical protein [Acidobacteriota bacterium]MBP7474594.1 hypothetical protein [Pyrinomonadaceae bacterium]MBP9109443.1 hypothetical protein [Pyrinomonadaceae bacterium]